MKAQLLKSSLLLPGLMILCLTLIISLLSCFFDPFPTLETTPTPHQQRPLMLVLGLFLAMGFVWLFSIQRASKSLGSRDGIIILLVTFSSRLLLIPSYPIQEIDLYRYLWDGAVINAGVSPYQYAPGEIDSSGEANQLSITPLSPDQKNHPQKLQQLFEQRPAIVTIHQAVHYPQFVTIYPPVSQAVFAVSLATTPKQSSRWLHVVILKAWLVLFDLIICGLIAWMLRRMKQPWHWGLLYWWNPLILKEIANSGHLDVIAACFVLAGLACLLQTSYRPVRWLLAAVLCLSLGVGAKLFPMLLIPLVLIVVYKRHGLYAAFGCLLAGTFCCTALLSPMLLNLASEQPTATNSLTTFLTHWEMNDLLFQFVLENLKPTEAIDQPTPWFVLIPNAWRTVLITQMTTLTEMEPNRAAFLMARILTLGSWLMISLAACFQLARTPENRLNQKLLELSFRVQIWFWMLSPTQNPWYLIGSFVLLPWSRCGVWKWLSLVCFAYYFRFWLQYHTEAKTLWFSHFNASDLFFQVVVWLEFGPLLMAVLYWHWLNQNSSQAEKMSETP